MIEDSGERVEYSTGGVRDIRLGKGRFDLMPTYEVGKLLRDDVLISSGQLS